MEDESMSTLRYLRVVGDIGAVNLHAEDGIQRVDSQGCLQSSPDGERGASMSRTRAKNCDSRVYAFRPLSLVGQPALFHVTPDARFPPGRARLDDPFEVVDPAFERVLVDCECARVGAEHEGDGRGGVFAKARAFAGFGAPFDDEVLEYLGEAGVFHDRGDGGGGAGSVDLVGAAKEAEDRGQVDGQQRFERGSEAGARGDEFERGPAEGAAFGDYASDEGFGGSRVAQEGDKVVGELCGCASSDDGLEAFQCAIDLFPGIFSLVEGEDSLQVLSLCTQVAQGRDLCAVVCC